MSQAIPTRSELIASLASLSPQKLRELDALLFADDATSLESEGWQSWLTTIFPRYVPSAFASYQTEFWEWLWGIEPSNRPSPFVAIWPRGGAKSTSTELGCVAIAARNKRRYVLYVAMTQEQADDHVQNVAGMIESSGIEQRYPALATRDVNKFGSSKGWRRNRIRTATGFTIDALGLDTAARGVKLEEMRPDLIIFDDIDSETDSREMTEKKIKIITRKLIPAGSSDVALLFVQNLVHKDSVIAQMADGRADFAADRYVSGPTPALRGFDYEREGTRTVIISGEATWPEGMSKERCQEMVDDMGISAFLAECQHKVDQVSGEKSFREYDEIYHVITWSEFAAFFGDIARDLNGRPRIPARWKKERGLDWGTTVEHPSAVIFSTRPGVADPLKDCVFTFGEIIRPIWPPLDPHAEAELVSPGRVARAIKDFQRQHMINETEIKGVMSHEASAALNTFLIDLPQEEKVFFSKWKARKGSGVPQIQEVLAIDRTKQHPFRRDPVSGEPIMGRPRHYIVVADGQGELYYDAEEQLKVRQAVNEQGLARLRAEIPEFNEYATGAHKIFDDAVDGWRGEAAGFFVTSATQTREEMNEQKLRPEVQLPAIQAETNELLQQAKIQSRDLHLKRMQAEQDRAAASRRVIAAPRVRFRR